MIILNDLLWFSILIPSFALAGHFVVYRSLARFLRPVEYVWLATTCGMLVFTAAVFALGVIHVFTGLAAMAVIASLWSSVLFARVRTRSHVAHLTNTFLEAFKRCHRLLLVTPYLSVMTILIAGTAFLGCLTPEVRGDPIIYHITEAWLYVLAKGHIEIRSSALTYIPQNQQLLYALGLCLGSDSLAKLLHWLPGVLLLLGAMTLARRLGLSRRYAVAGGFLLATCPVWFYLATTTYIDLAVGNYLLCAVFLMVLGAESLHVRRLSDASAQTAVAGIFTGAALGCKYTAGIVGYAPMALSLLW
ncbi:MAG: hypothetical protein N2Z21_00595, partial [Candidatus Sumerlaeaceae bacterium]|nr:hypothetical protein [Candidatus Sumerlaeaceae bacterium]